MKIRIRRMIAEDIDRIVAIFSIWNKFRPQYERYFEEQQRGERIVLVALMDDTVVGYVTLLWQSHYPPFRESSIPEIADLNVITEFQKQGIGTALIQTCEQLAREAGKPVMGIGTGTTPDYAAAQRLYPHLGYVEDGRGITSDGEYFMTRKL